MRVGDEIRAVVEFTLAEDRAFLPGGTVSGV